MQGVPDSKLSEVKATNEGGVIINEDSQTVIELQKEVARLKKQINIGRTSTMAVDDDTVRVDAYQLQRILGGLEAIKERVGFLKKEAKEIESLADYVQDRISQIHESLSHIERYQKEVIVQNSTIKGKEKSKKWAKPK